MPAILSHHLFGRAVLARQNNRVFTTRDARDAFLLGNQGPDPLFYATLTPHVVKVKTLGVCMHHEHIEDYLEAWRQMLDNLQIKDHVHEVLQAYVSGFLCHYTLDAIAHPYIYALENRLCNAGVEGLGPEAASFVHSQIEADLDVYLLYVLTGRTLEEYCIPKQLLYASDATLSSIDPFYRAAAQFYQLTVPRSVLTRSVKDMRSAERLLYSPGGTRRRLVGRIERLVRPHSLLQALSHRPEAHQDTWFANEERLPWEHPQTGEVQTSSYQQLFDAALKQAAINISLYRKGAPLSEITHLRDFSGEQLQSEGV